MVLTIKLSLWSFVRLGGFLLVFGVLSAHGRLLWCCSKSETILGPCASNTRRDRRVDFERSKGGWRYHPAGALGKIRDNFFHSDDGRTKVPPQSHPYSERSLVTARKRMRDLALCDGRDTRVA